MNCPSRSAWKGKLHFTSSDRPLQTLSAASRQTFWKFEFREACITMFICVYQQEKKKLSIVNVE